MSNFNGNIEIYYDDYSNEDCDEEYPNDSEEGNSSEKFIKRKNEKIWEIFVSLGLRSSISQNKRNFSRVGFFVFWAWKTSSWNILILGLERSISQNIRNTFFWENIRTFLILRPESSIPWNIGKTFFEKI